MDRSGGSVDHESSMDEADLDKADAAALAVAHGECVRLPSAPPARGNPAGTEDGWILGQPAALGRTQLVAVLLDAGISNRSGDVLALVLAVVQTTRAGIVPRGEPLGSVLPALCGDNAQTSTPCGQSPRCRPPPRRHGRSPCGQHAVENRGEGGKVGTGGAGEQSSGAVIAVHAPPGRKCLAAPGERDEDRASVGGMPGAGHEASVFQYVHEAGHVTRGAVEYVAELALGELAAAVEQPDDLAHPCRGVLDDQRVAAARFAI
jgi:hypothetical protein